MRACSSILLVAALAAFCGSSAYAQDGGDYPSKPIRILVGSAPGGFPDTMARLFGEQLGRRLKQTVTIENRPGAGTAIVSQTVARAKPDGYTLLVADSSMWAISPHVYKTWPVHSIDDFAPVTLLGRAANFLAVTTHLPVTDNLASVIAFLKANPDKYNFGSSGIGSMHHLTFEIFKTRTGVQLQHVPFKGTTMVLGALAGGEIALAFQSASQLPGFVRQGKVKVLGVSMANRSPVMPDIPTFAELGIEGMDLPGYIGLLAPKDTPVAIVNRLFEEVRAATQDIDLRRRLDGISVEAVGSTPQETMEWMRKETDVFARAVKDAGIVPE